MISSRHLAHSSKQAASLGWMRVAYFCESEAHAGGQYLSMRELSWTSNHVSHRMQGFTVEADRIWNGFCIRSHLAHYGATKCPQDFGKNSMSWMRSSRQ